MTVAGQAVSIGWVLGLVVFILSLMMLFMKLVGVFPMEPPVTIVFVFTGLLGLARLC